MRLGDWREQCSNYEIHFKSDNLYTAKTMTMVVMRTRRQENSPNGEQGHQRKQGRGLRHCEMWTWTVNDKKKGYGLKQIQRTDEQQQKCTKRGHKSNWHGKSVAQSESTRPRKPEWSTIKRARSPNGWVTVTCWALHQPRDSSEVQFCADSVAKSPAGGTINRDPPPPPPPPCAYACKKIRYAREILCRPRQSSVDYENAEESQHWASASLQGCSWTPYERRRNWSSLGVKKEEKW